MRAWRSAAFLFLFSAAPAAFAQTPIQRYLASLRLGDTLKQIEQIYPPKRKWTQYREPGGEVIRIHLERGFSEWFPPDVHIVRLGLRRGKLVHLQLIYDEKYSRKKSISELTDDLSLMYGEPRRDKGTYFWWDAKTVLAVSNAEIKTKHGLELRTGLELMEKRYFGPFKD